MKPENSPTTELAPLGATLPVEFENGLQRAAQLAQDVIPANTKRAYTSSWRHFDNWCCKMGVASLPAQPVTLVNYLQAQVEQEVPPATSTIEVRLAAIKRMHESRELFSPTQNAVVKQHIKNIRRRLSTRPKKQRLPMTLDLLAKCVEVLPNNLRGKRDKAILLLGFASARRRSELVRLCVEDIQFTPDGMDIFIQSSKTDQEGKGATISVVRVTGPLDAVGAVQQWIAEIDAPGHLFRRITRWNKAINSKKALTGASIDTIVRYAVSLVLGEEGAKTYGSHSLRAGLATESARLGFSERAIMSQTLHKNVEVARGYIRRGTRYQDNPSAIMAQKEDGDRG